MKNEKGVTILALVITIAVMAIIGSTMFFYANGIDKNVENDILLIDLQKIQQSVIQEYNKKITLNSYSYVGDVAANISAYNSKLENRLSGIGTYYILDTAHLEKIGVKNATSTYLVCYETGEVANITEFTTTDGKVLHLKGTLAVD